MQESIPRYEQLSLFPNPHSIRTTVGNVTRLGIHPTPTKQRIAPKHITKPIRSQDTVSKVYTLLKSQGRYGLRNATIFALGISIGRRAGDLLRIKVGDIYDGKNVARSITIKEEKTGKTAHNIAIDDDTRKLVGEYIRTLEKSYPNAYLFPSQKRNVNGTSKPINVRTYRDILAQTSNQIMEGFQLSTHEMRKTWAWRIYDYYSKTNNGYMENGLHVLDYLQHCLNHSSKTITLVYIGVLEDMSIETANNIAKEYQC